MKNIVLGLLFLLFSCETEKQKSSLKQTKEEKNYTTFDKNELEKADTIEILYAINGCCILVSVKTILIRNKISNQYLLNTYYSSGKTSINKKVPIDVLNGVFDIQEQFMQHASEENIYCLEFEDTMNG